jgi:hypothetical protein
MERRKINKFRKFQGKWRKTNRNTENEDDKMRKKKERNTNSDFLASCGAYGEC